MATRKVAFQYTAEDGAFKRVSDRVGKQLGSLQKQGLNFTSVLKLGAGTLALNQIGRGVGALASALSTAYQEQEDAVIGLQAALNATGKSGADNFRLLATEASRLQTVTRAGDDAILKASASLATLVPSLDVAGLRDSQTALVALADTFFDGNIETAALQLGKTLGSSTNALARYGITIDNTAAPASEKLAEILGDAKMQAAFAGATARAQTYGGSLVQLSNAQGDLRESLGGVVVESLNLTSINQRLTTRILALTQNIEENRDRWIAWGRVIASGGVVIAGMVATTTRSVFNLVQILGRLGLALGSLANRDFAGVKSAVQGIRGDIGDLGDAFGDQQRRVIQFYNNLALATEGINATGTAAEAAAAAITAVGGATEEVGDPTPLQKLNSALAQVVERYRVYGREVDVVAEKQKLLRAEIDRQLGEGASAQSVAPLVERLGRLQAEWDFSAEGAAAFAEQLRVTGAAGVEVANQIELVAVRTERVATAGVAAGEALRRGLIGAADQFGQSFRVTLDGVELRVGEFINSILARLSSAFATSAFLRLIGLAFGGPLGGISFGTLFRGSLGIGQDVVGLPAAAGSPTAALAGGSTISFDFSSLPPARDPRQAQRDGEWQRHLVETLSQAAANGHRVRVR